MSPLSVSFIAFAIIFSGTFLGMFIRNRLPEHHLSGDTKDVVRLGTGLIGTIAALVLGLLISSAQSTFFPLDRRSGSCLCVNPGVQLGFKLHTHQKDVLAAGLDLDPGFAAQLPHRLDELVRRHGPLVRRLAVGRIGHIGVCDFELALAGLDQFSHDADHVTGRDGLS